MVVWGNTERVADARIASWLNDGGVGNTVAWLPGKLHQCVEVLISDY